MLIFITKDFTGLNFLFIRATSMNIFCVNSLISLLNYLHLPEKKKKFYVFEHEGKLIAIILCSPGT